jgi:hypothetical protein
LKSEPEKTNFFNEENCTISPWELLWFVITSWISSSS